MPMPRDWLPPYRPGDRRNDIHRAGYNTASQEHPEWNWWQCTEAADDYLAAWLLLTIEPLAEGRE